MKSHYPLFLFIGLAGLQTTSIAQSPTTVVADASSSDESNDDVQFDLSAPTEESLRNDRNAQTWKEGEWLSVSPKAVEGLQSQELKPEVDLSNLLAPVPVIKNENEVPAAMWAAAYYVHSYAVARSLGLNRQQARTLKFLSNPSYIYNFKKTVNPKSVKDLSLATAFQWVRDSGCASYAEMAGALNADNQPPREAVERAAYNRGGQVYQLYDSRFAGKDDVNMDDLHKVMAGTGLPIALSIYTPSDWGKTPQEWDSYVAQTGGFYHLKPGADLGRAEITTVTMVGYNAKTKASRIVGSWGRGWGKDGFLWIKDESLKKLIRRAITLDLGSKKAREKRNERLIAAGEMAPVQDHAVVVGINSYPDLRKAMPGFQALQGCENDANAVAASFLEMGWNVEQLNGKNATRSNILQKIKSCVNTPGRFVFYFAGHGSRDSMGNPVVLPVDALPNSDQNDLTPEALQEAIGPIRAASKNVLIDACFAGGFAGQRDAEALPNPVRLASARGRFVWRTLRKTQARAPQTATLSLVSDMRTRQGRALPIQFSNVAFQDTFNPPVNGSDIPSFTSRSQEGDEASPTCFLVASQSNQIAQEWNQFGIVHGGFTRNLLRYISGRGRTWGDIYSSISRNLKGIASPQSPCLTPGFYETGMFETWQAPPLGSQNRADIGTIPDPKVVQLLLAPNQTRFNVGDRVNFKIQVTKPGYIVLLDKGTSGNTSLLYPVNKQAIQEIQAGQSLAEGDAYFQVSAPTGKESYELYWFNDRGAVETFFDTLDEAHIAKSAVEEGSEQDALYCASTVKFDQAFSLFKKRLLERGYSSKVISSTATIDIANP